MVSFHFISHSKLNNHKNVLQDIKIKVKQIHGTDCNIVFWVVLSVFYSLSIFSILKMSSMKIVQQGNGRGVD